MTKGIKNHIETLFGLLILCIGLYTVKTTGDIKGIMRTLPYLCIGLGCGIFGHGMGNVISQRAVKNNPDIEKQLKIDKEDERNVAIANRAKAKSYDMMVFIFGALMFAFALMGIDMAAVLLLAFAYLFVVGYGVFYRIKYDKEM